MDSVAGECKKARHHPEWTNVYIKTHVRWTTHNPPGLSGKDVAMAVFCDEAAAEAGEVEATEAQMADDEGMFTTNRIGADDCCTGKQT